SLFGELDRMLSPETVLLDAPGGRHPRLLKTAKAPRKKRERDTLEFSAYDSHIKKRQVKKR
ncbi:MAG: hypothetical protein IJH50_03955, partial [Kiritimatiellae bacterium]|nr:hypothetical protein [Kiritimatiellia bacterium]